MSNDKFYITEMPKKPSSFEESIDQGAKRLIEVNKTYRYPKESGGTDLYRVKSIGDDFLIVEDMQSKKSKRINKTSFQNKLNEGKIYVSASNTLLTALERVVNV